MSLEKRTTLQQIADHAGVTKMTVSRFLKAPAKVAPSTGERIQQAIDLLGYIPNRAPDLLSNARSYAIGVLVPSLSNQVFSDVVRGIESVSEPAGYQTMLAHYGYNPETEAKRIENLLSYQVDALLLCENQHTDTCLRMLKNAHVPVIEMMDVTASEVAVSIGFDNEQAAFEMTEEILARNYQEVVYLAARLDSRTLQRQRGYERAMRKHRYEPKVVATEQGSSVTLGRELMMRALGEFPGVDAVFCTNDDLAAGAVFACQAQGLSVPDQIGIAGFHGHDFGQQMTPTLASVLTPRFRMGQMAATRALAFINGTETTGANDPLVVTISPGRTLRSR